MLLSIARGTTGLILRVKLFDSTKTDGSGLEGLTHLSSGLVISTILDSEAAPTYYSSASATIESITTLGTYAAPSTNKCRFAQVDVTYHKGVYEIQLDNARLNVSGSKYILVSLSGAANLAQCDFVVQLADWNEIADAVLKRDWSQVTGEAARSVLNALRFLRNKWSITGGTMTVTKEDDATSAWTSALTTNAAADPVTSSDPT